jgi:flagellar biosynthesis GTPase FlhF
LFSKYQACQAAKLAGLPRQRAGIWRVGSFLENSGLLPLHAQRVVDDLRALHGDAPPALFGRELDLAGALLRNLWHAPKDDSVRSGTHVFIGPPGTGKTVCLCKWLARAVLVEGRTARVLRLDGRTANTSEAVSIYAEILNVPVLRAVPANLDQESSADLLLVDLPGVSSCDAEALGHLAQQIQKLPSPQVHLVLNAAYETSVLLAQTRAFQALPLTDLVLTHLDEEPRWGKVWNLVLGTNFPISFLSAGQNIPGEWLPARPEEILVRQMPEI